MSKTLWAGNATQAMKDMADAVHNKQEARKQQERIGNHVIMMAWRNKQQDESVQLTRRGTERVAGFTGKRDYRKDF